MSGWTLCRGLIAALMALAFGGNVVAAAIGEKPVNSQEWNALVAAARKEGKLELILSSLVPERLRKVMPEFEKKYGVRVNFQTGGGGNHAERILAERRVGRFTLDVWIGGANTALIQLIPNGALAPIPELLLDPEVTDTGKWYKGKHHYTDPEGRYIFTWGASPTYNISYNTKLVDPNEIKSYADVLNPKWKGRIVSWSPASQGTGGNIVPMVLNPKIGEEWFRRWATEMDVTIVSDARQGAEWVALGRFALGMFGLASQAETLKDQGFPIRDYMPHAMTEGEVLSAAAANIMVMDRAPNPHAAKLFVNWALSRDAQAAFIEAAKKMDSLRTDVPNDVLESHYRIDPSADYTVAFSDPEYITRQGEVLARVKQILKESGYR